MRSRVVIRVITVLILLALYLGPRVAGIDRMLNTDEVDWLGGAANVYTGVAHGDLGSTYQLPHPGATTIWAGVLAYIVTVPGYPAVHPGAVPYHHVHVDLRRLGVDAMDLLITARIVKLLLQAALFLVAIHLTRRLFGRAAAMTTAALVSFDPFLIGHDRFLHIDGLVAISSFAAVLAIASASTHRGDRRRWALAGGLSALAWLTRFTAGVLAPIALAVILLPLVIDLVRLRRDRTAPSSRFIGRSVMAYGLPAMATSVVLWPTSVVAPVSTFTRMWAYVSNAATVGHELPMFYNGQIVHGTRGGGSIPTPSCGA